MVEPCACVKIEDWMKDFIHKLLAWTHLQERVYFLFALLYLVPNMVFFVTEPQEFPVRIAAMLIPLGVWLVLLALARKPGVVAACLLPKIVLDSGQLVALSVFGESVIAVDMLLNLTSSNASEASELLSNILKVIAGVLFFYVAPTLWLVYRSLRGRAQLTPSFRKRWSGIGVGLFVVGLLLGNLPSNPYDRLSWRYDVYPLNAVYNIGFAVRKAERNSNYAKTSADFRYESVKQARAEEKREVYVLVVGETSRAMEWSLYGYERPTTPRMETTEGLVYFRDVVTQSNNTHKSVPIILSPACAEDYDVIYRTKSIVSAFKEAGFRTLVIANQKLTTSMINSYYHEADKLINLNDIPTGSILTSHYDGEIIPFLKEELEQTSGNLFVVLHTYGSHFNYHERYPASFRLFTPDKALGISAAYREQLRNAYDNSIAYTDEVLGQVVDLLRRQGDCSAMLYLSDHGEDIFDDARGRYLHASPIPTYYQLHIPYLIWFSKAYQEAFPQKYATTKAHEHTPASTNTVFHTMLDLASVQTLLSDSTKALSHAAFQERNRMYLGDHDDPIPFWELDLKRQDFEMLDRQGIAYPKSE